MNNSRPPPKSDKPGFETMSLPLYLSPNASSRGGLEGNQSSSHASMLQLLTCSFAIPSPNKPGQTGEDAFFVGADNKSIGVADGVGGWADIGVDSGKYSRDFMAMCDEAYERMSSQEGYSTKDGESTLPLDIMTHAHDK